MRSDMAKVIVERPRIRGWAWKKAKGYRRRLRRLWDEGAPVREGIKAPWRERTKILNEHLGPLRRYLNSQIGRPWDKVFSEICAHINRNSAVQDHVRDHVDDYVTLHVLLIDGVPCSGKGGRGYGEPLYLSRRWKPWYVCPRSGLLKKVKPPPRAGASKPGDNDVPRYVRISETLQCRLIDGAWHLVTLKRLPAFPQWSKERDVLLDRLVSVLDPATAQNHYGAAVYAVGMRRLARRDLRQLPIPIDAWK
jgi:hypothetical protein